jgi:hypothetical protein
MRRSGKKFNIWIAYSDLFTNLSTFLFISALGVFAAFGSGVVDSMGTGSAHGCSIPATAKASMEAEGSLLQRAVTSVSSDRSCSEYYTIGDFRYRSDDVTSFLSEAGERPTKEDFKSRICGQIWFTLARQDFEDAGGRIRFVSIAQAPGARDYPTSCKAGRQAEPKLARFSEKRSPVFVISDCLLKGEQAYPVCSDVLQCLSAKSEGRDSWCRSVWMVHERANQSDAACRRGVAELQAKALFDQCDGVVDGGDRFPDHRFEADGMQALARRPDGRRELWRRVDFDSVGRDSSGLDALDGIPPDRMSPGSVVVELSFRH